MAKSASESAKTRKSKTKRRPPIKATLAKFEAMDPDELEPDQRAFRSLAIRALQIELALRAKGLIGKDGELRRRAPRKTRR